jgi:prevent-host-death family protein
MEKAPASGCFHRLPPGIRLSVRPITVYIQSASAEEAMRQPSRIKPITYLKANAADVLHQINEDRRPLIITQNGEAKAVLQDVATYEETQETLALLKILALGGRQVEAGRVRPLSEVVRRLRSSELED